MRTHSLRCCIEETEVEAEAKSKLRGSQANTMNFQGEKIFIIHFVIMQSFDVHFFFLHLCKQLQLTSFMHLAQKDFGDQFDIWGTGSHKYSAISSLWDTNKHNKNTAQMYWYVKIGSRKLCNQLHLWLCQLLYFSVVMWYGESSIENRDA